MLSKSNATIKRAIDSGDYRVEGDRVFNVKGNFEVKHNHSKERVRVKLYSDKVLLHRLIAYKKFGNDMFVRDVEVHHIDDNPKNNCPDNLEIVPGGYHLVRYHSGENNKSSKLKWDDIRRLRKWWDEGIHNYEELGRRVGIAGVNVKKIIQYERWRE